MFAVFGLGHWEVAIIGIVGVLIFGTRLPKIARSIGSSFLEFRRGLKGAKDDALEVDREVRECLRDPNTPPTPRRRA